MALIIAPIIVVATAPSIARVNVATVTPSINIVWVRDASTKGNLVVDRADRERHQIVQECVISLGFDKSIPLRANCRGQKCLSSRSMDEKPFATSHAAKQVLLGDNLYCGSGANSESDNLGTAVRKDSVVNADDFMFHNLSAVFGFGWFGWMRNENGPGA
jgi:hypothetical protein